MMELKQCLMILSPERLHFLEAKKAINLQKLHQVNYYGYINIYQLYGN